MNRVIIPILIALLIIVCVVVYLNTDTSINSGDKDVLYNGIVYERAEFPNYGLSINEDDAKYIGDFLEIYDYGQELPWGVYVLNSEANLLYSAHAIWIKPGYVFPGEFGEEFSSINYAVCEGNDLLVMEDNYKEEVTQLVSCEGSFKLEDIIETEPANITEFTEHDYIKLIYKGHANMSLYYRLCSADGEYYLNVHQGAEGTNALYKIKPEYVDLLTSMVDK